jgi:prepilin-type N-terminal cleavage/methylation domain-containing protein
MGTGRPGYTLLELVLVLALVGILLGLAYPSLEGAYSHYQLKAAADEVRAAWVRARSRAVEDGRAYRFAIVPGHGNFRVAPDGDAYWGGGGPPGDDPTGPAFLLEDALPRGLRFTSGSDGPAPAWADSGDSALPPEAVAPNQWVKTAVFLPDGTADADVDVVFQGKGGRPLQVRQRALTGVITTRFLDERGR